MRWMIVLLTGWLAVGAPVDHTDAATAGQDTTAWKSYTNARFGFSVRYPGGWKLGQPLSDGVGVTLHPPVEHSLVALSGHMNLIQGSSQDQRQTLEEFTTSHRRIITELYGKKKVPLTWQKEQNMTLAGFPARRLAFTYQDERRTPMLEVHIFTLGRNEGRGVRIKVPASEQGTVLPLITTMLETYQPGRDQNAVSPLAPNADAPVTAPRS